MFYKDIGKGPTVVLIHGFLENGRMWDDFAEKLSQSYRVIIPDLLGHGHTKSIDESHTMQMQGEHVIRTLNDLGLESASFIGHSMGGYIAMAIARDFPDKVEKLMLFFSNSLPDSDEKKAQRLKAVNTAIENRESFIHHSIRNLFNVHKLEELKPEIEKAREWAMETPLDGITSALRGMTERTDTTQVLQDAAYPIEIVLGEFDTAVDAEKFQTIIPGKENIQVDVLPVGHMGHLEAPDASFQIINDFLKR